MTDYKNPEARRAEFAEDVLSVPCPICKAEAGWPCVNTITGTTVARNNPGHWQRLRDARPVLTP